MDYKRYKILYPKQVIQTLDDIFNYISNKLGSQVNAKNKIASIRRDIQKLELFPEVGFNADERFGKKTDPNYTTRGIPLSRDYLVLYTIVGDEVRIAYLFSTKSNYMKLLKPSSKK